jgi:hypothetical protein
MERIKMDKETKERRKIATKMTAWKLAYYCEMYRNGKSDDEAKRIADEWIASKFN